MAGKGGRIPPDNRGPQAKGVGKNSKRHDMERRSVPPLHGSDLQQGDVQALEQGQRTSPPQTQQSATQQPAQGGGGQQAAPQGAQMQIPDAIDFLGGRQDNSWSPPVPQRRLDVSKAMTWLPILRRLASGPGASGVLVNAFINQARLLSQQGAQPASIVDLGAGDAGIAAMLEKGMFPK